MFNSEIIIRKIDKENKTDVAFITILSRMFGKEIAIDSADLYSDAYIKSVINNTAARIIEYKGEYIAYAFLDSFEHNLIASIHGMINLIDKKGQKTSKYLKLFQKYRVFEQLLEDYFKFYRSPAQINLETIEAYVPEYLQNHKAKGQIKYHPTAKMLLDAGFMLITNKPRRNACRKNNKPCAVFIYQLGRQWLLNWLMIEKNYINGSTPKELSQKYGKNINNIEDRISRKKLMR